MERPPKFVRTDGSRFIDGWGKPIRFTGVCVGGWLNMENFITGYAANETLMREKVAGVIGPDRAQRFFERLLNAFYGEADAAFLGSLGMTIIRIPVNYHHFESDEDPFAILPTAFDHLDRAVEASGRHGIYSIIDLHALPGSQNHHWHSDNSTHEPHLWRHPHFQDRVENIWKAIAEHYKDNTWVAGYNLMNEPADETRAVVGPLYRRLFEAVRAIDPHHTIFLDGNTYSTEFDMFDAEPWPNTVYSLHDYVASGLGRGGDYPGYTDGTYIDKEYARKKFLQRSEYARQTGTPIMVGEFAPIYTGDERVDAMRRQILADQLELYGEFDVSWTSWMYKDLGRQGLVNVSEQSPYRQRFDEFVTKKNRLAADQWGSDRLGGEGVREVSQAVQDLMEREFPNWTPYPWGRFDTVATVLNNLLFAQPLADDYAELFRGLSDNELDALADSFSFEQCEVRESLRDQLVSGQDAQSVTEPAERA
ncbi:glycoside hydrolase family 5 protein [Sinomonas humi]|uniref:glycoside hydrolase family 5 protein n=1 Tax=Sinomonas humi TaxID=1338436 RepID=UPI00068D179F|nr:cellulase family glycosylhydrolase [Sinomonas humi]